MEPSETEPETQPQAALRAAAAIGRRVGRPPPAPAWKSVRFALRRPPPPSVGLPRPPSASPEPEPAAPAWIRPRVERLHLLGFRQRLRLLAISFLPPPASLLVRWETDGGEWESPSISSRGCSCSPSPAWRRCGVLGLGLEWAVVGARLNHVACWAGNSRNSFLFG